MISDTLPDFREVRAFVATTRSAKFSRNLFVDIGSSLMSEVKQGFNRGVDPYGKPWRRSISGGRTLVKSGDLIRSITSVASARGLRISTRLKYARIHNRGGVIRARRDFLKFRVNGSFVQKRSVTIPKRQYLIETGQPLSRSYKKAIRDATTKRLRRARR